MKTHHLLLRNGCCGLALSVIAGTYAWQYSSGSLVAQEAPNTSQLEDSNTPPLTAPVSVWMEKKLQYSQDSLKLLATGDMAELQVTARRMRLVSKVEGFVRSSNPTYRNHLRTFELANEELIRQADRGSIEGAALAFNQLTTSCVTCHVAIRQPIQPAQPAQPAQAEKPEQVE